MTAEAPALAHLDSRVPVVSATESVVRVMWAPMTHMSSTLQRQQRAWMTRDYIELRTVMPTKVR